MYIDRRCRYGVKQRNMSTSAVQLLHQPLFLLSKKLLLMDFPPIVITKLCTRACRPLVRERDIVHPVTIPPINRMARRPAINMLIKSNVVFACTPIVIIANAHIVIAKCVPICRSLDYIDGHCCWIDADALDFGRRVSKCRSVITCAIRIAGGTVFTEPSVSIVATGREILDSWVGRGCYQSVLLYSLILARVRCWITEETAPWIAVKMQAYRRRVLRMVDYRCSVANRMS